MNNEQIISVASTILRQIKQGIGMVNLMCLGLSKKTALSQFKIQTDKGIQSEKAFGGGVKLVLKNHRIDDVYYSEIDVYVIYQKVPDTYALYIVKGKKLIHKQDHIYCDEIGEIIFNIVELGTQKPNYGE